MQSVFAGTDKYRLIINDDPSTTISIAWNQITGNSPLVYYDTVDHGTDWSQYANSKSTDRIFSYRGMNNHFTKITGLTANTSYYFLIKDSEGTSQRFWFKTAPDDFSRLSFIAGGDSRNNRLPRQNANKLVSKLKPHAVLFGGDMTDSDSDNEWQMWLDDWQLTTSVDGRMTPIIPVRGNHENASTVYNLFNTSNMDEYYSITFGNDLFTIFCLNSEISVNGNQLTWLTSQLETNTSIWKGAQYHKPMRPHTSTKAEGTHVYNAWANLFYENEVRLVVDCDSHTVKTTWPVKPSTEPGSEEGFVREDTNGTVYMGEGCWGAPLRTNDDDKNWTRNSGSFNQFKLIFIDQNKIEARTIIVNNADLVDEVSNNDPFTLPNNLDIWNPSQGDVVEIFKNSQPIPVTSFDSLSDGDCFNTGDYVSSNIQIDDPGSGISHVDFFVDGTQVATDFSEPYTFNQILTDGVHEITATTTDINNRTDNVNVMIYVGLFSNTIDVPIASGNDDVEESENGLLYTDSSDLEMVYDDYQNNGYQKIGLRFQNIQIPQGATINSAYIQFRSDETNSETTSLEIHMEDVVNANEYVETSSNNLSQRNYSLNTVSWNPVTWNLVDESGLDQRTPSLVAMVQNVISKTDWVSGNAVSFMITGLGNSLNNTSSKRVADSYEGNYPAALVISYSFDCQNETLSLNSSSIANDIKLFPNPVDDELNIKVPSTLIGSMKIDIINLNGQTVYSTNRNNKTLISLKPNLSSGIYLLQLTNSNLQRPFVRKIVVK